MGVSQSSYRSTIKTGFSIEWLCSTCGDPQAESMPILFSESDLLSDSVADPAFNESSVADPPAFELASDRDADPDFDKSSITDLPAFGLASDPDLDSVTDPAFNESSIADPPAFELASDCDINYVADPELDESSIADPPAAESPVHQSFAVTFEVINDCTTKGKPKLVDSRGYSYGNKCRRANATDWVCTRRPKVNILY